MDSIDSYEQNSLAGGAAGELLIRHSLEHAFAHFGSELTVLTSDAQFDRCDMSKYDVIIVDSWTWAAKGWVPKRPLIGHEHKIFVLDFFGSEKLRGNSLKVPLNRILTAYGSPWNSFLGYYIPSEGGGRKVPPVKENLGVIWGKDGKHFKGHESLLKTVASLPDIKLCATSTVKMFDHDSVQWMGHQTKDSWRFLLQKSKYLIGLGNPLLGPSAIDAISNGCMFLNPIYREP
eukprot:gene33764-41654_t